MKRLICIVLALLCLTGAALASPGDRVLTRFDENMGYAAIRSTFLVGRKVYMFTSGMNESLMVYDLDTKETAQYSLQAMMDRMNGLQYTQSGEADQENANITEQIVCWFEHGEEILALVTRVRTEESGGTIENATVRRLVLDGSEASVEATDLPALDWSSMTEDYGTWTGSKYVSSGLCVGENLYLHTYDDSGNAVLVIYDLTTGTAQERYIPDLSNIGYGTEDRILLSQTRWGDHALMTVSLYDGVTEEMDEIVRFDLEQVSPRIVTYDEKTDILYYVHAGEIYRVTGRDLSTAEAVNDCPLSGSGFGRVLDDGFLVLGDYSTVIVRNSDPAQRSEIALHVRPYTWSTGLNNAYYDFTESHGNVTVVMEDYGDENALLQAMMNRDDRVDVYLMEMSASAFSAIYDRGFMADLTGSAILKAKTESMYPLVQDSLMKDGKIVAIPVNAVGDCLGYNTKGWKKLGLTEDDVPKTWNQFFDLLETLPDKITGSGYVVLDFYTSKEDFRQNVIRDLLSQYTMSREDMPYNSEELRGLLSRLDQLDYEALGILPGEELENQEMIIGSDDGGYKEGLITTYSSITMQNYGGSYQAFQLSFRDGEDPVLPFELSVGWVNPYSQHQEEAIAFLEALAENMGPQLWYTVSAQDNEPKRYPDHEEQRKNMEKWANEARLHVENAQDEEEKENWEKILADYERELSEFDANYWMISPDDIELYHGRAAHLRPVRWSLMRQLYSGDESDAFYSLFDGYLQGQKSAEELLSYIDRKVQMMRLEGN